MEQLFNINKIIEYYDLNVEDLAKVLYPTVKYPKQAFDRVLKGDTDLSVKQVETLASYAGVLVSDLFSIDTWKGSFEDNCLTMRKGDYKVRFNYNGSFMTTYKNNKCIDQKIINTPHMSVLSCMRYLDELEAAELNKKRKEKQPQSDSKSSDNELPKNN